MAGHCRGHPLDAAQGVRPDGDVDAPAPYPTLVTLGRNADGATVLVDLDTANGIVSFGGVTDSSRDVVGSLAVELATNLWSEGAHVSMVGFGDDLSSLAPARLSYWVRLDDALDEVTRRTDAQVQACERRKRRTRSPRPGLPTRTRCCGARRSSSCPRRRRRRSSSG